jgi:DNA helicase II / ATP-dependent DNA helicase PcrA
VAQTLPGIGPATAAKIVDLAGMGDGFVALADFPAPAKSREDFAPFVELLQNLARAEAPWPSDLAAVVAWLRPHLERRYEDASTRIADLEALERMGGGYPSRERFLAELTLDPADAASDEAGPPHRDEDYLVLSTIHSAKGQEWRSVFVLNVVDGCIPSEMATDSTEEIEEERRLLYVAMTRARDELSLIAPQRFFVHGQPRGGDRHVLASRTRFIPAKLLPLFERIAWPVAQREERTAVSGPRVDLAARMRAMWR